MDLVADQAGKLVAAVISPSCWLMPRPRSQMSRSDQLSLLGLIALVDVVYASRLPHFSPAAGQDQQRPAPFSSVGLGTLATTAVPRRTRGEPLICVNISNHQRPDPHGLRPSTPRCHQRVKCASVTSVAPPRYLAVACRRRLSSSRWRHFPLVGLLTEDTACMKPLWRRKVIVCQR